VANSPQSVTQKLLALITAGDIALMLLVIAVGNETTLDRDGHGVLIASTVERSDSVAILLLRRVG
jgi:hypothetical protein